MRLRIFCFLFLLAFCIPLTAIAEIIELKDGRTIETSILEYSNHGIKININNETQTIANSKISKINGKSLAADLPVMQPYVPRETDEKTSAAPVKSDSVRQAREMAEKFRTSFIERFSSSSHVERRSSKVSINFNNFPVWVIPAIISAVILLIWFPFFIMARKMGLSLGWQILIFVPLFQIFTFLKIAGKSWWWIFLLLIPLINLVIFTILYCNIAQRCGKDKLLGLLILIPVINLFFPWYLALSMQTTESLPPSSPAPMETKHYSITPFEDENQKS